MEKWCCVQSHTALEIPTLSSSQWKLYQKGVGAGRLDMRLIKKNMERLGIQMKQGRQQQEERGTISMKFCEKGSGWAWVTATWQARIKTSDLSSMPGGLWPESHLESHHAASST